MCRENNHLPDDRWPAGCVHAGAIIEAKVTYLGSVFLVSYRLLSKVMTVSYPL